jgi:hypothetical protein
VKQQCAIYKVFEEFLQPLLFPALGVVLGHQIGEWRKKHDGVCLVCVFTLLVGFWVFGE